MRSGSLATAVQSYRLPKSWLRSGLPTTASIVDGPASHTAVLSARQTSFLSTYASWCSIQSRLNKVAYIRDGGRQARNPLRRGRGRVLSGNGRRLTRPRRAAISSLRGPMLRSPEKALLLAECHFRQHDRRRLLCDRALFLTPPARDGGLSVSELSGRGRRMGPAATTAGPNVPQS
jgi:hypothetical protein